MIFHQLDKITYVKLKILIGFFNIRLIRNGYLHTLQEKMVSIAFHTSITSKAWLSGCTIKKVDSLEMIMAVDRISMIYYEH